MITVEVSPMCSTVVDASVFVCMFQSCLIQYDLYVHEKIGFPPKKRWSLLKVCCTRVFVLYCSLILYRTKSVHYVLLLLILFFSSALAHSNLFLFFFCFRPSKFHPSPFSLATSLLVQKYSLVVLVEIANEADVSLLCRTKKILVFPRFCSS